jgi:MFS family permease
VDRLDPVPDDVCVGAVIRPVYDRGHLRLLLMLGSFGIVFGHMMLSLCHAYWQALLAQGFVVGMGGGCLFVPALAILKSYFSSRLGLAVSKEATGSSIGGVIYPVMFTNLIGRVGLDGLHVSSASLRLQHC